MVLADDANIINDTLIKILLMTHDTLAAISVAIFKNRIASQSCNARHYTSLSRCRQGENVHSIHLFAPTPASYSLLAI